MVKTPSNQIEKGDDAHPRVEKLDHLLKAESCPFADDGQSPNRVDT